jgi:hypothetical protein
VVTPARDSGRLGRWRVRGGEILLAPPTAPLATSHDDPLLPPLVSALALATGLLLLFLTFRRSRAGRREVADPSAREPVAPEPPAQRQAPRTRPPAKPLLTGTLPQASPGAAPPRPGLPWSAEIQWVGTGTAARFAALAWTGEEEDRTVLAQSRPLEWPPSGAAAVRALGDAVADLERALLTAGWEPRPAGAKWYAKRFGWQPVAAAGPAPSPEPGLAPSRSGRFVRRAAWPDATDELWRCEIRWDAGVVNSRFYAIAYPPGQRRGRLLGGGATFKWLMRADPDPADQEHGVEFRRLADALEAAGWERVASGARWYSARFVWRQAGTPPELVESHAPGAPHTP